MRKVLNVIFLMMLVSGCQTAVNTSTTVTLQPTPLVVKVTSASIGATATAVSCTSLLDGMILTVEPTSSESANVQLSGLSPGESLTLLFVARPTATQTSEIEIALLDSVGENGRFQYHATGLSPLSDAPENAWSVKVIHSQGVACQDFTLP